MTRFSFQGFKSRIWFSKHKKILMAFASLLIGTAASDHIMIQAGVAVLAQYVQSSIDYFIAK